MGVEPLMRFTAEQLRMVALGTSPGNKIRTLIKRRSSEIRGADHIGLRHDPVSLTKVQVSKSEC